MLQIVQGMYFRPVPLTNKVHRGIYYTNLAAFGDQPLSFIFGRLLPSSMSHGTRTLTVEAREQLETLHPSGNREVLSATSGDQLLDEVASVIAFCLNVTCVRDHDMARRLISSQADNQANRRGPASLLRQTFDAMVVLTEVNVADLDRFLKALVALERKSYEAAIRAIRQIVDATLIVDENATLAFTLMVAALESLGQVAEPTLATWDEYDAHKRRRIDAATKGLGNTVREEIQAAILANEHHGLQRKFIAFVLQHVEPSYYRAEAVDAIRPIDSTQLPKALRQAYAVRSRNVHALEQLAREVWMARDRADTATVLNTGVVLSPEGLARLSRHVIRRFIERAPVGIDPTFNYRSALPGFMPARLAPQYWIASQNGFNRNTASAYFNGMLEHLLEGLSNRSEFGLVDMIEVLEKIETSALSFSKWEDRIFMAGIMSLWNSFAPADRRRTLSTKLAVRFEADLARPSMVSFALALMLGNASSWSTKAIQKLADERRKNRLSKMPTPIRLLKKAARRR